MNTEFSNNHKKQLFRLLQAAPTALLEQLAEAFDTATRSGSWLPLAPEDEESFRESLMRCWRVTSDPS